MKKYNINFKFLIIIIFNFFTLIFAQNLNDARPYISRVCAHAIKINFKLPIVIFDFYCHAVFITNVNQNHFVIFAFSSFSKTASVDGFSLVHFVLASFPSSLNNSCTKNIISNTEL